MTFDKVIIPQLPPIPEGDWNQGHITKHPENGNPYFSQHAKVILPTICSIWHPRQIDWLELEQAQWLRSNVYTANFKTTVGGISLADEIGLNLQDFPGNYSTMRMKRGSMNAWKMDRWLRQRVGMLALHSAEMGACLSCVSGTEGARSRQS